MLFNVVELDVPLPKKMVQVYKKGVIVGCVIECDPSDLVVQ